MLQEKQKASTDYNNCQIAHKRGYISDFKECQNRKEKYDKLSKEYERLDALYKKQTGKSHFLEAKEKGY